MTQRRAIDTGKLRSPHPIGEMLPGVYREGALAMSFTAALDQVLAPVVSTLDNIDAYLDPATAPVDILTWLGSWLGVASDESAPLDRRRELLRRYVAVSRRTGTVEGLKELLRLHTGTEVEVRDSGGTTWSMTPQTSLPGDPSATVTITVDAPEDAGIDLQRVERIARQAIPAHVTVVVETRYDGGAARSNGGSVENQRPDGN